MRGERGFTLIELLVVLAIVGTLLGIGSMQFGRMQKKSSIEQQTRATYAKMTEMRVEALYTKSARTLVLGNRRLTVYASSDGSGPAIQVQQFPFAATMGTDDRVSFEASGMMTGADRAICVEPDGVAENPGNIDSVVVTAVRAYMGKRNSGGACVPAQIVIK